MKAGKCKIDQAFITRVHVIFRSYHIMYVGYKINGRLFTIVEPQKFKLPTNLN